MRPAVFLMALMFASLVGTASPSDEKYFAVDGVVVAVQKTKDEVRMNDPHSMGDMVEVWMVRIDNWPQHDGPAFILVQYTHRDTVVKDRELDSAIWRFKIRAAPAAESGTCMSWWTETFLPTALGSSQKLPPPKELACFLMQTRPIALREMNADVPEKNSTAKIR